MIFTFFNDNIQGGDKKLIADNGQSYEHVDNTCKNTYIS